MSWTIAIGEADARLRALAGRRALVDVDRADVVLWPARRHGPISAGDALNVIDLRDVDPAAAVTLQGAGLLLVASATAYGAWAVRAGDVPLAVVPPVAAPAATPSDRMTALHILTGPATADEAAAAAAAWAAARGLDCGVAEGGLALVASLGAAPAIGPGAVVLDLRTGAGRIDASPALLALLAAGAPVLFGEDTPLRLTLESAGVGWRFATVEAGLAAVAELGTAVFARASEAALGFVTARFGAAGAQAAFERAVEGALARVRLRTAGWARLAAIGHVLVISDEGPNLRHVRVDQPFDALVRHGAIAGYSVLSRGAFVRSTVPVTPALRFGAVWVQRSADPQVRLLLRVLDRPFCYDLDDNLLISPAYREAFAAEAVAAVTGLVRDCTVLSCATGRLAAALPDAAAKAVVTPNLAYAPALRVPGVARSVVWASSDAPALAGSRREVERAVRDFCRAHGLDLLCIGNPPPALFAAAGLRVEHVGLLPYPAYLSRLRAAAPGILVAPLETAGDAATQGFVDAKSDIKVIEAGLAGLVGAFSRATPFAQSDLAPEILCDNSYAGWMDGLTRARAACLDGGPASVWPARRDAAATGLLPWAEALRRAPVDLSAAELDAARRFVSAQAETLLTTPALFDEADYLHRHADVAAAMAAGVIKSGYRHFLEWGFREGRAARRLPSAASEASYWWERLLHETGMLEASVAAREGEIVTLRERLAIRKSLPDPAPVPADAAVESAWLHWGRGETRASPCPVCAAVGPHAVAVVADAAVLLRCAGCGTCFYADRTAHAYESEALADVLLQFSLEQNASIHHQTGLLFGADGVLSVLDVGCGFGFAVDLAEKVLGWRAVGIDPSATAAAGREQLGADIRNAYLTDEIELGDRFDRVIASEVIEHVADPYALLALLRAWLAPGGTLALTTPNAEAIAPGADRGRLLGILAPGVHLTLFTERSLALALRTAGFAAVAVHATADTLVAEASDWKLRAAAGERHAAAYRAYLEGLMERAAAGSALWNGAAGRLLTLLLPGDEAAVLAALFDRIAAAWRERFGFDLAGPQLPAALSEAAIRHVGARALGQQQPFNLATVLMGRAEMADRVPGRAAEAVLRWAAPAYRVAVETRRVLQAENLVDLDLKRTAWRARLLMLRCLAELAPGLEGALLQAAATASPGQQADWDAAPDAAVIALVAPFFVAAVAAERFDEARRVAAWVADADAVAAALATDPGLLLRTLFMRGVLRLMGDDDRAAAKAAFERLGVEARRLGARDYEAIAAEHATIAGCET